MEFTARKIFECNFDGQNIVIIYHDGETNPYRIYRKYWEDGWHRKLLEKYADFNSCLMFIDNYYRQMTNVYA